MTLFFQLFYFFVSITFHLIFEIILIWLFEKFFTFFKLTSRLSSAVIDIVFDFHRFLNSNHRYVREINENIKQLIVVIIFVNQSFVLSIFNSRVTSRNSKFIDYSSKWVIDIIKLRRDIQIFRDVTTAYRFSSTYLNFLEFRHAFSSIINDFSSNVRSSIVSQNQRFHCFSEKQLIRVSNFLSFTSNFSSSSNSDQSFVEQSISHFTFETSIVEAFDSFNSVNIREISIEKNIYTHSIDFNSMINIFDSNFQIVIAAIVTQIVISIINDFRFEIRQMRESADQSKQQNESESSNSLDETGENVDENENADENLYDTSFWRSEKLNFFDFHLSIFFEPDLMIKNDKNIVYRNVHFFCERIRDLIAIKEQKLIRINFNICMIDTALIWYISKLKILKRVDFRNLDLKKDWIKKFKLRFKSNHFVVINVFIVERYTIIDVRNERESFDYIQQIVSHAMNVNFQNTHQQLIWIWKNLDSSLKRDISTSSEIISLINFLNIMKNRKKVWQKVYTREDDRDDRINDRRFSRQISKFISRQNDNRDDYQSFDDFYAFYFYYFFFDYYSDQNSIYNNQKYQYRNYDRQSNDVKNQQTIFVSTFNLFVARQFLRIISENASDFKNQISNSKSNAEKENNNQQRDDKTRIYVIDEKDEKQFEKFFSQSKKHEYHVENENLNYYDQNNYSKKNEMSINFISFVLIKVFQSRCRHCKKIFTFNNVLHDHLRVDCNHLNSIAIVESKFQNVSNFIEVYFIVIFTVEIIKNQFSQFDQSISISTFIRFNVDSIFELSIDYEFKNWNYIKTQISLFSTIKSRNICMNIDANVIFVDRVFYKEQISKNTIRTMIISLKIRELDTNRHENWKYVICDIHFADTKAKNDKSVTFVLRRKIHLMNNFKINMLIDNDVFDFENIIINSIKKQTHIINIDVIISLNIRSSKISIQRFVHIRKITVISLQFEMTVVIHHTTLFANRDFLFEFANDINFTLYVHLVDVFTFAVFVRNDRDQTIQISRNFRLDRISKFDFFNVFQIDIENADQIRHLTAKKSKFTHQNDWFKKFLTVCITIYIVVVIMKFVDINAINIDVINVDLANADLFILVVLSISSITSFSIETSSISSKISQTVELVLFNEIIIHQFEIIDSFIKIVKNFFSLWQNIDFVKISEQNWMRISLKSDWKSRVFDKIKVYSLRARNRKLMNKIFDELHVVDKMFWINEFTFFFYSIFCVWKLDADDQRKKRIVIDIRDLNVITQSNVYFLSLQNEIIVAVRHCNYISIIDCFVFFYQWRVHSSDRHKLTVMSHKNQENFNVVVMKFKNSSTYVQRQIDRLFRQHKIYVRVYVDDIVIFSRIKKKHETHFRVVFQILKENNVSIKFIKTFLDYSSISLLDQKMNFLDLVTAIEKLKIIVKLRFSINLRQLKFYLDFIDWMRDYISFYVDINKSLQKRKIVMFRHDFSIDNARRTYAFKTRLNKFFELKIIFFKILQNLFSKFSYLVHSDSSRRFFIDLNANKKFDFGVMLYYVKKVFFSQFMSNQFSSRHVIESIFFFSRFLTSAETRYWSIELEIAEIVWVFKKVRHIIEIDNTFVDKIVIYIDHDAVLNIVSQTSFITLFTNKFNFRLIRVSDYIQRFDLNIRHKSNKQHIVFDVLFKLTSDNINVFDHNDEKLNALFTVSLIKMKFVFKQRILNEYKSNLNWQRISSQFDVEINSEIAAKLFFYKKKNEFIFRFDDFITKNHVYESRKFCIFHSIVQNILELIHNDDHFDYVKCFEHIVFLWYIRDLSRYLRDYLKHCSKCQMYQIKRHASYEFMQSIFTSIIFFHTITMNFILILSFSEEDFDIAFSIIDKFIKRMIVVSDKKIWSVDQWDEILLKRLNIIDWDFLKVIISNRNRKFLFELWTTIFKKLNVKLFYFTVYHFQTNDQSKRTN